MKRKLKIALVTIFSLVLLGLVFQKQIAAVVLYRLVAKKIERINFPFKEADLLGEVSPVATGKLAACGAILSVKEVASYEVVVNDDKELHSVCFLENKENKNQGIFISSQTYAWRGNVKVAKDILSLITSKDDSDKLRKMRNDLNSTQSLFEQNMIILAALKEHKNFFNYSENLFTFTTGTAVTFDLRMLNGTVEHQKIGESNLLKIYWRNKDLRYLLITEDNKVYEVVFSGFGDRPNAFIKSYLKGLLAKDAIVFNEAAAKRAEDKLNEEINQIKEKYERAEKALNESHK